MTNIINPYRLSALTDKAPIEKMTLYTLKSIIGLIKRINKKPNLKLNKDIKNRVITKTTNNLLSKGIETRTKTIKIIKEKATIIKRIFFIVESDIGLFAKL